MRIQILPVPIYPAVRPAETSLKSMKKTIRQPPVLLAASEEEDFVQPFFEPNQTKGKEKVTTVSTEVSVEQVQTGAVERTSDFVTIVPARPWRKPETVLRVLGSHPSTISWATCMTSGISMSV